MSYYGVMYIENNVAQVEFFENGEMATPTHWLRENKTKLIFLIIGPKKDPIKNAILSIRDVWNIWVSENNENNNNKIENKSPANIIRNHGDWSNELQDDGFYVYEYRDCEKPFYVGKGKNSNYSGPVAKQSSQPVNFHHV